MEGVSGICRVGQSEMGTICRPMNEGGLGLKKLEDWNKACLARLNWMIYCRKESLWIAWIKVNLLKGTCFGVVRPNANSSWCWKKILKTRVWFRPMLQSLIGNGQ